MAVRARGRGGPLPSRERGGRGRRRRTVGRTGGSFAPGGSRAEKIGAGARRWGAYVRENARRPRSVRALQADGGEKRAAAFVAGGYLGAHRERFIPVVEVRRARGPGGGGARQKSSRSRRRSHQSRGGGGGRGGRASPRARARLAARARARAPCAPRLSREPRSRRRARASASRPAPARRRRSSGTPTAPWRRWTPTARRGASAPPSTSSPAAAPGGVGVASLRRGPHERALLRDGRVGLAGRRRASRGGVG